MRREQVLPTIGYAALGALVAGIFGITHDQLTYTIGPEYFTKFKFEQFSYANLGLPPRVFVAEIGFLASWWVGLLCGWFLARLAVPSWPAPMAARRIYFGFLAIFTSAATFAVIAFLYGLSVRNAAFRSWQEFTESFGVRDVSSFMRVAYIHNASYAGGLMGLIGTLAYLLIDRRKRSKEDAPRCAR